MESVKKSRGRPKKDTTAMPQNKGSIDNIQSNYNTQNDNFKNNVVENFDEDEDADLKQYLKNKDYNKNKTEMSGIANIDEEVLKDIEGLDKESPSDKDIPNFEYNPLEDAVKERGYTKGISSQVNTVGVERIIAEPVYSSGSPVRPDVDEKLLNPNEGNNNSNSNKSNNNSNGNSGGNSNNYQTENNSQANGSSDNSSFGSNSSNSESNDNKESSEKKLTPKEKREGAEKTAEIALLAYRNYIPLPFIHFGQFNVKKLKDADKKGEIDINVPFRKNGTTFIDHVTDFNRDVEAAFEVSDAEVEAIREPLIDVLMEKEVTLTPTQRLMFVAGQFLVAKVINVIRLVNQQKSDMADMKEMHKEKMEYERNREAKKEVKVKRPSKPVATTSNVSDDDEEEEEERDNNVYIRNNKENLSNSAKSSANNDIKKEEVVSYVELKNTTPSIEDVLNMGSDEEEDEDEEEEKEQNLYRGDDDDNDIPD